LRAHSKITPFEHFNPDQSQFQFQNNINRELDRRIVGHQKISLKKIKGSAKGKQGLFN
jgi:hypothetical protein